MMAVVGDACDGLMYDLNSAREIAVLGGHMDYCFAIAWHPDGQQFVTGSQVSFLALPFPTVTLHLPKSECDWRPELLLGG